MDHFKEERYYLSNQVMGESIADKDDLKPKFQQYAEKNDEELRRMEGMVTELEAKLQQQVEKTKVRQSI